MRAAGPAPPAAAPRRPRAHAPRPPRPSAPAPRATIRVVQPRNVRNAATLRTLSAAPVRGGAAPFAAAAPRAAIFRARPEAGERGGVGRTGDAGLGDDGADVAMGSDVEGGIELRHPLPHHGHALNLFHLARVALLDGNLLPARQRKIERR